MNIGFMGLGKLGLPCALAIEEKGHSVFTVMILMKVSNNFGHKTSSLQRRGASERLKNHNLNYSVEKLLQKVTSFLCLSKTPHDQDMKVSPDSQRNELILTVIG